MIGVEIDLNIVTKTFEMRSPLNATKKRRRKEAIVFVDRDVFSCSFARNTYVGIYIKTFPLRNRTNISYRKIVSFANFEQCILVLRPKWLPQSQHVKRFFDIKY